MKIIVCAVVFAIIGFIACAIIFSILFDDDEF